MQLKDYFIEQYAYVKWADHRCLDAAATVPEAGYHKELGFSFGTVHKTLLHMMGAQDVWVGRWKGESVRVFPSIEMLPTLASVRARWESVHDELLGFVGQQTEESLMSRIVFNRNNVPHSNLLWHVINHCADHATFHRGQLNSLIKLAGGKPAVTMHVDYRRQQEGQIL